MKGSCGRDDENDGEEGDFGVSIWYVVSFCLGDPVGVAEPSL